jgi:type 1 glutamine amidotransferase
MITCISVKNKKENKALKALVVDGRSTYHKHWKEWTPVLLKQLDESGLFMVDVYTASPEGESLEQFNPDFAAYDVVVSTYDGAMWPDKVRRRFEKYIKKGGGFVSVHAADNSFPQWPEYNEMIGLGGWGGRSEKDGPYLYLNEDGERVIDDSPGKGGHHGQRHEFLLTTRSPEHPIMQDLPSAWLHTEDELYDMLRGPARNINILATAYSSPDHGGTGRHEPLLMTLPYGKGRIFHTTLGHTKEALASVGFMTTFVRGAEWAASGKVTYPVPDDFPTKEASSARSY